MNPKKLDILITGGLGFIGSNLAIKLIDEDHKVTIIDSLIDGYGGNIYNLKNFENKCNINISDIRDENSIKYLVKDKDVIFNLAAQIGHQRSMINPIQDLEINVRSQLNLLESIRKFAPDSQVVFTSTRQIYGKPQYLPVDEKHPINPVDINGINKFAAEQYHLLYYKIYGIKSTILRLTNTYGPRMRIKDSQQTFIGFWIKKILLGEAIPIYGEGDQIRDFNFVDDVVEALISCINQDKAYGKTINIGSRTNLTLKELGNELKKIDSNVKVEFIPFPKENKKIDIGNYYSNIDLSKEILNWSPEIKLNKGLKKTINFYKKNLENYL